MTHPARLRPARRLLLPLLALVTLLSGVALAPASAEDDGIVPNPYPDLIARWEPCAPDEGVTIIVNYGVTRDGIDVGCAPGPQATGVDALQAAGFELAGVGPYGLGFICRINGYPVPEEESCQTTPGGNRWWSYWHGRPGGRWGFSGVGAANPLSGADVNAVQGWGFGTGPGIDPMHGSGPSSFSMPDPQESSVQPARLARDWLAQVVARNAELAAEPGSDVQVYDRLEQFTQVLVAIDAGADPAGLAVVADAYRDRYCYPADDDCQAQFNLLELWANPGATAWAIDPQDPDYSLYAGPAGAERMAVSALALDALGLDPSDFGGSNLISFMLGAFDESGALVRRLAPPDHPLGSFPPQVFAEGFPDVLEALFRFLPLNQIPGKILANLDLLLAEQDEDGGFHGAVASTTNAVKAMVAARDAGVPGLDIPVQLAGSFIAGLQDGDGGVPPTEGAEPTFESTARAAVGMGLARTPGAVAAARWMSRYQITEEYAGTPDPVTGEEPAAYPLIGSFLPTESALRNALAYGLPGEGTLYGPYNEARPGTGLALEAFTAVGPYGPYDVSSAGTLWFDTTPVGSTAGPVSVTLTNDDPRTINISGAGAVGEHADDFAIDASDCVGILPAGASCVISATFVPTEVGTRQGLVQVSLAASDETIDLPIGGTAGERACPLPEPSGLGGEEDALVWLTCELDAAGGIFGSTFDFGEGPQFFPDPGLTMDALLALGLGGRAGDPVVEAALDRVGEEVPSYVTGFGEPSDRTAGATAKSLLTGILAGDGVDEFAPLDLEADLRGLLTEEGAQAGRFSDRNVYGDNSNGFGQTLAVMALSHTDAGVPPLAVEFLLDQQCPAGGFRGTYAGTPGCEDDASADTDYTAMAVQALLTSPEVPGVSEALDEAVEWLLDQRDEETGGFGGTGFTAGLNTNSSGLIAQALRGAGMVDVADGAAAWIASNQLTTGSAGAGVADLGAIAYNPVALADAVAAGVTDGARDQWRRATTQAVLAFSVPTFGHIPDPGTDPDPDPDPGPGTDPDPDPGTDPDPDPVAPVFSDVPEGAYFAEAVRWAVEHGITKGLADGRFGSGQATSRAHAVAFLWRLAGSPTVSSPAGFGDVPADVYYAEAVAWAAGQGITTGVLGGGFAPDAPVTRGQMVVFLWRMGGSPVGPAGVAFTDVPESAFYARAVAWAAGQGITLGAGGGLFVPDATVTRAQAVTFLWRYATQ